MGCALIAIPVVLGVLGVASILGVITQRIALFGMNFPQGASIVKRREFWLTFTAFCCILLSWIGGVIMACIYAILVYRHVRRRRTIPNLFPSEIPLIPSVSLAELMVMAFSLGGLPAIVQLVGDFGIDASHLTSTQLMYGFAFFPAFFLSALYRLAVHRIPLGWSRYLFLFCFPYAMFGCLIVGAGLPFMVFVRESHAWLLFLLTGIFPVALVFLFGRLCLADARAAQRADATPDQTPLPPAST
ncbi:MAG TPA: hypothetical protein VEJ63_15370 [Planctomycetota bacterium]|nr:hypothetical protein [Planctomycetota bacterium]